MGRWSASCSLNKFLLEWSQIPETNWTGAILVAESHAAVTQGTTDQAAWYTRGGDGALESLNSNNKCVTLDTQDTHQVPHSHHIQQCKQKMTPPSQETLVMTGTRKSTLPSGHLATLLRSPGPRGRSRSPSICRSLGNFEPHAWRCRFSRNILMCFCCKQRQWVDFTYYWLLAKVPYLVGNMKKYACFCFLGFSHCYHPSSSSKSMHGRGMIENNEV